MIYPKIVHGVLVFCCLSILCMAQYIWPVGPCPYHPQPQVAQAYGDFEKGELPGQVYFHSGVDIPGRGETEVYALEDGFAKRDYGVGGFGICIYLVDNNGRIWRYHHLTNLQFNPNGENVMKGQLLGYTAHKPDGWIGGYDDHLHLGAINISGNPIDNPLLYLPYSDPGNGLPFVWFPEIFIYNRAAAKNINGKLWWLYPTYAAQPTPIIYDYVDIVVKAQDYMGGTLANGDRVYTGVFEPGFWITDMADNSVLGPLFMHQFSGPLPNAEQVDAYFSKDNPSSHTHDFYYIVTNLEGDVTKCWATKARSGGISEGDPKARINSEAIFPDKEYKIWLLNRDAGGHLSQDVAYVCLDNFRPYVTRVRIEQAFKQRSVVKYEAHWPHTPVSNTDLGELIIDTDDYCRVGIGLTFTIEFSEEMETDVLPTLQVQMPNEWVKVFNPCFDTENNLGNIYS